MKQISHRVIYSLLLIICFLLALANQSITHAEQLSFNSNNSLIARNDYIDYRTNALNDIYFWEPCSSSDGSSDSYSSGICGQTLTSTDVNSRLREAVEKFGGFAMDMQIEYGVPWETIFMHMYQEAQMGLAGSGSVAAAVEQCGNINIMGYVYGSKSLYGLSEEQMGNCKPIHGDNKALAAQFSSYEDMIASFYTDYLRNGYYDAAFAYLDPNNYNLEKFLETETNIYSTAGWDGRVAGYGRYKDAWNTVKDTIYDVAKEKGWPTSAELAKQKNIPIGGKHPVNGDIKNQMNVAPHSLSACNGLTNTTSSDSSSNSSNSSSNSSSDSGGETSSSSTSFKIDGNTPAERFWFYEQDWNHPTDPTKIMEQDAVIEGTKFDEDFGYMPYIYADNYDITYTPWPPKMTLKKNGGNSTRKYYWIVLPGEAYVSNMGDKYVAYFENLKEPIYFITYDTWSCNDQPSEGFPNSNYCQQAKENPNNAILGEHSLGYTYGGEGGGERAYEIMNTELAPRLGKLTCLHRLTTESPPPIPESVKCSGATCHKAEQDYPSYPQSGQSWSSIPYSEGNIGSSGCGLASMAMLASAATGKAIYPDDVYNITKDSGIYPKTQGSGMVALDKLVADKYNFTVEQVDTDDGNKPEVINKMREYLKKGYMLHFSGGGNAPFTPKGHYIGIFSIDNDDNVFVADSSGRGNATYKLSDVVNAGYHGNAFSAIQGGSICEDDEDNDTRCLPKNKSDDTNGNSSSCSAKVLDAVEKIIKLAKKNGYSYVYGGGHGDTSYFDSILKNGANVGVDCTGFASLVMYAAFGAKQPFSSEDISSNPDYVEVPKSDVQPGDIFAFNYGCPAHGGIVIEVKNNLVTKIAQTGRTSYIMDGGAIGPEGRALGYTFDLNGNSGNLNCVNGAARDAKFYRYKGCK